MLPTFSRLMLALSFVACAGVSHAADPFELVRGLRDNGLADLSLEYLKELEAKKPDASILVVIPLERAKVHLELADDEPDNAKRAKFIADARAGFDDFLAKNATHPRRAEAALALARLVSVQAKGQVSAANRLEDDKEVLKQKVAARPLFLDASKRFGLAATEFGKKLGDANLTPDAKASLQSELYQARLNEAINQFNLADTYPTAGVAANDLLERAKVYDQAKELFSKLASEDDKHPVPWIAKAWTGQCELEKKKIPEAIKLFAEVKKAGTTNPAAKQAARVVKFFELRYEYGNAFSAMNKLVAFRNVQRLIETWLAEGGGKNAKQTPEVFAARYYLAKSKELQANFKYDDKTKQVTFLGNAKNLLEAAAKDYRELVEPENDYTARAVEDRNKIMRVLIGDPTKIDIAKQKDFEFLLMAAQVQLYNTMKDIPADKSTERQASAEKVLRFFERLDELPIPKGMEREATTAKANYVYALVLAGKPYEAAVLGDHLARTLRTPSTATLTGLYAVSAYRQSAAKLDGADNASRLADADRAISTAKYLDASFPSEANTDVARVQASQMLLQSRRFKEAFELSSRVNESSPYFMNARFYESIAAYELLKPLAPGADASQALPAAQQDVVRKKIIADLSKLPDLAPTAAAEDVRLAILNQLQLAEMHFLSGQPGFAPAEAAAAKAATKLATYTALPAPDKQELGFRIELVKMRAAYVQALLAYQGKKFPEAFAKIGPILADAAKNGSVKKADMAENVAEYATKVDEYRRDKLLGLAIQIRIREGAVDKVGQLLDVLKKLGGNLANSSGTLDQLVDGARPQLETLRREGKTDEAEKLSQGIAQILDKVSAEPGVTPATMILLGRGLASIGNYDKAIEYLSKIAPPASPDLLTKRPSEVPEAEQVAVARYKLAQLELVKAYRQARKFTEAEAILKTALPTKDANNRDQPNTGWANNAEFKREAAMLLEGRAEASTNPADARKLWGEARGKWTEQANQYLSPLRELLAGKRDEKSAFLALLKLNQLPPNPSLPKDDKVIRAALAEPTPPAWLKGLLDPNGEYVPEMRNTITRIESQLKPIYHDFVFESTRCITRANLNLLKANPANLNQSMDGIAKSILDLEKANPDLSDAVKERFTRLLEETPPLKDAYKKAGGSLLLGGTGN